MSDTTAGTIERLLRPTHDMAGWHATVRQLDPAVAVPVLVGILRDSNRSENDRGQVATLLGMLGDPSAVVALLEGLEVPQGHVRARSVLALAAIGSADEQVVAGLIRHLKDDDDFVRESSAKALGALRPTEAVAALEEMSEKDPVWTNRDVARDALGAVRGDG